MKNQRFKYPRTPHLPWSPGWTSDDIRCVSVNNFAKKHIVITEKMDGENTSMYPDHIHARSIDSRHHSSRHWVKSLHARIRNNIPENWRLCGENVYAKHSIEYCDLPSYFLLFSIWDERNVCLSWEETKEWAQLLELDLPNVMYEGEWDLSWFSSCSINTKTCEGYVVRTAGEFHYSGFSKNVAKWVRESHVQSDKHWMHSEIVPNKLITKPLTNKGGCNE